jgi:hypothetical protein
MVRSEGCGASVVAPGLPLVFRKKPGGMLLFVCCFLFCFVLFCFVCGFLFASSEAGGATVKKRNKEKKETKKKKKKEKSSIHVRFDEMGSGIGGVGDRSSGAYIPSHSTQCLYLSIRQRRLLLKETTTICFRILTFAPSGYLLFYRGEIIKNNNQAH